MPKESGLLLSYQLMLTHIASKAKLAVAYGYLPKHRSSCDNPLSEDPTANTIIPTEIKIRTIKCTECDKFYLTKAAMLIHRVKQHKELYEQGIYERVCNAKGRKPYQPRCTVAHIIKKPKCTTCKTKFGTLQAARAHYKKLCSRGWAPDESCAACRAILAGSTGKGQRHKGQKRTAHTCEWTPAVTKITNLGQQNVKISKLHDEVYEWHQHSIIYPLIETRNISGILIRRTRYKTAASNSLATKQQT